jgi:hypothetical protein
MPTYLTRLRCLYVLLLVASVAMITRPTSVLAAGPYTAPKDKALVYVIQGPTGSFAELPVYVNGRSLQYLKANTYFAFLVSPGTQEISTAASARAAVSLVVGAGNTYYLRIVVSSQDVAKIVQLGAAQGDETLTHARRLGDRPVGAAEPHGMPATAAPASSTSAASSNESAPAAPESGASDLPNTIILKAGTYKLSKGTQDFLSATHSFDTKSTSVWGLGYEYRVWRGVAVGAEYSQFKNSLTTTSTSETSTMDTRLLLVKVKKYFELSDLIQPYIGLGIGAAWANFDGAVTGNTIGAAYEGVGGVDFRFKRIGIYTELRYLSSTTSGKEEGTDNNVDVHVTGSGAFAGVSVHF